MKCEHDQVVEAEVDGITIRFFIDDPIDTIQRRHLKGEFYEREELEIISRHFRPTGVFLDVGANVGNHAVFAAKILKASRLILVEPNPKALAILVRNLALNGIDGDTTVVHRYALSDHSGFGRIVPRYRHNLGAAQVFRLTDDNSEAGNAVVLYVTGDEITLDESIDFVKIDVEGQAVEVLRGLQRTIAANRPPIFIEIDDAILPDFESWLAESRYAIVDRFVRYATQANYMILPAERLTV